MATSSITKNFVVSGEKQVEMFANAIEESYQESLTRPKNTASFRYRELHDPTEIKKLMEKTCSGRFSPLFLVKKMQM